MVERNPILSVKKGETHEVKFKFNGAKGPYGDAGNFLYTVTKNGDEYSWFAPDFVSACLETNALSQKGKNISVKKLNDSEWNITANGKEYEARRAGADPKPATPQADEFNGVVDISGVMKQCWVEAGLIMGNVDRGDVTADQVLNETGLTARCMFIQYHKDNNRKE